MDATEWALWKRAVVWYSKYRPRIVAHAYVVPAGTATIPGPERTIGVLTCSYGRSYTHEEWHELVLLRDDPVITIYPGWLYTDGAVALLPETTAETSIRVVWKTIHPADDTTLTFPTIPPADRPYVEWLVEAERLEERARAATTSPQPPTITSYTVGATTVRWSSGETAEDLITRAQWIRQQVDRALGEPMGVWA